MKQINVKNLGQLAHADVTFGDMTVFVGPQASGKSIFLQLIKLALDFKDISKNIKKHGYSWQSNLDFLPLYFGEGMQGIWNESNTFVQVDNQELSLKKILSPKKTEKPESLFLIPAQRVMTLRNGWPRAFTDYEAGDPYVVKQFSENLRQLMELGLGRGKGPIFPQVGRMDSSIRNAINDSIFSGAEVTLDSSVGMRKRIVLKVGEHLLPFMTWSAGQREFVPLLMGLYWLMPSSKTTKRKDVDWIVIEEPEMGLHPQAISALLIVFLELMHRGYKVIVSTHSPQILDMVWAIQNLSESKAPAEAVFKMFGLQKTKLLSELSEDILRKKSFKTYFFSRQDKLVTVKDISSLDPGDMDDHISDWGGLTSFSTRASEIVAKAIAKGEYETQKQI